MNWYAILTMATTLASIVGVSEVMTHHGRITNAEARTDLLIPIYSYVLLWFFVYCYPIALWPRGGSKRATTNALMRPSTAFLREHGIAPAPPRAPAR